tara:strand:+ start:398 stop:547 length:150 start_codon:yes stop_codon:yes gene_type:complete
LEKKKRKRKKKRIKKWNINLDKNRKVIDYFKNTKIISEFINLDNTEDIK